MAVTTHSSDEALMRRVQANEPEAFGHLYDRHCARALRVARSVCHETGRTEEVVQDGFLLIWRSRASYRPDVGSFQTWAMTIFRNRAIDSVRRDAAARRPRLTASEHEDADATSTSMPETVIPRTEGDGLRTLLGHLPHAQAEVIALAYFGELTHIEIARRLSLPEGTVKGRLRLGLEKLRAEMDVSV